MNTILTLLAPERLRKHYQAGHWRSETIYSLARHHADATPDGVAVRHRELVFTYHGLVEAADALAADLHRRGVRRGERVAVWMPSRVDVVVALLACSRNGYVCCPSLHRDHTVADIVELAQRMRAAAVLAEEGYGADGDRHDVFSRLQEVSSLRHVYRLPSLDHAEGETWPLAGSLDARPLMDVADPEPLNEPDTVVYLAFTSGTTGAPKGVMHSDNTLLANSRAMVQDWNMTAQSVIYTLSPLSHNLGFGAMINALTVGGTIVLHDLAKGESLVERLRDTRATFLFGVPTHALDLLNELAQHAEASLPDIEGFRISGAPITGDICEQLLAYGIKPQSGYGMTEGCSHHYTRPDDDPRLIVETSGRACPGYEVKIWARDNPELELPPGEIGQIGGRGASLMLGYFNDQMVTEESFNRQGWFMTGDLGWMDEQGYLRITGRKKDVIIRGGHNIYPARIETLAMRHRGIARAAALPMEDARLGETVCLVVVAQAGAQLDPDEVLQHLDEVGLSKYDMPEHYLELDEVPLTSSGKILKRELVEMIRSKQVTPQPVRFRPTVSGQGVEARG